MNPYCHDCEDFLDDPESFEYHNEHCGDDAEITEERPLVMNGACGCHIDDLDMYEFGQFYCPKHEQPVEV